MAKSIAVPAFPVSAFTSAMLASGETVIDAVTRIEQAKDSVRLVYSQFTDSLILDGSVPKDSSGRRAIRKAVTNAIKTAVTEDAEKGGALGDILESGTVFKKGTLSQYVTGVILCYVNGVEWYASAANAEDNGGQPRPDWWGGAKGEESSGSESDNPEAPGEVETVSQDGLRLLLAKAVAQCGLLGLDDLRDAILDAVNASPLKPVPPSQ